MNGKLETCRNCPQQCVLETTRDNIVQTFRDNGRSDEARKAGRSSLSGALKKGNEIGCPESEVAAFQRTTLEVIDPRHAQSLVFSRHPIIPTTASVDMHFIENSTDRRPRRD